MLYGILADATVLVHLLFIAFVLLGGLLAFRWPKVAWVHVPVFLWGGFVELAGFGCPLTRLENDLRVRAGEAGYSTGFIEEYLIPLIYPELLFPGGFPRWGFIAMGIAVLAINGLIYWCLWRQWRRRR